MGIRFACHVCSKRLNIKQELAGRRGICPACSAKIRIPLHDTEKSTPVDAPAEPASARSNGQADTHQADAHRSEGKSSAVATMQATATEQTIEVIDDDPTLTWYVRPPSGGQYGPATGDILRQWISEGRVAATSLLWREGWPQWREAKEALPELVGRLPDAVADTGSTTNRVSAQEVDEFGLEDAFKSEAVSPLESHQPTTETDGRSLSGLTRQVRRDYRNLMILGLLVLAVGLVFALAFVLSR